MPSVSVLRDLALALGSTADYWLGLPSPAPPAPPKPPPRWLADLLPDLEALDKPGQAAVKALVKGLKKT